MDNARALRSITAISVKKKNALIIVDKKEYAKEKVFVSAIKITMVLHVNSESVKIIVMNMVFAIMVGAFVLQDMEATYAMLKIHFMK